MRTVYKTMTMRQMQSDQKKIINHFKEMRILAPDTYIQVGNSDTYRIAPGTEGVPQWNLPIVVEDRGKRFILVDTRPFHRVNGNVTKDYEVQGIYVTALLEQEWHANPANYENNALPLVSYFSEMMRQVLVRNHNIDDAVQSAYEIFLAFYMWQNIMQDSLQSVNPTQDIPQMFIRFATRKLKLTSQMVEGIVNGNAFSELLEHASYKDGEIISLDNVCKAANSFISSPAITIDTGTLINYVVRGTWFGHSSNLIPTSALEHPPLFAYMVYMAATNSTYRNTPVAQSIKSKERFVVKPANLVRWINVLREDNGFQI